MPPLRTALTVLAAAAILAVIALAPLDDDGARRIHAEFAGAVNLVEGADVHLAGAHAGRVERIALRDDVVRVTLRLDDAAWPLHRGTRARIRFGGTVAYSLRYVDLDPGAASAGQLADGAVLDRTATTTPVEFDELFDVFDPSTRAALGRAIDGGARAVGGRRSQIARGLEAADPATRELDGVLEQLGADPYALRVLTRSAATAATALTAHEVELRDLVPATATTFTTFSRRAQATRATLRELATALDSSRGALHHLDRSLVGVDALVGGLAAGAREARTLSRPLAGVAGQLTAVAPVLRRTVRTGRRSAPAISSLLAEARPFLARSRPVLERVAPIAACLRPYTPELAGLAATWNSFTTPYDATGHYARANVQQFSFGNLATEPSAVQTARDPRLLYAFVRPPGFLAGRPQYLPECGITRDGLDPAKDPEALG